jgi:hypothetical protein
MLNKALKFISAALTHLVPQASGKETRHKRDYIIVIIHVLRIFFADDILATAPVLRIIIVIAINKYNILLYRVQ